MKYIVTRTGQYGDGKPCEEASLEHATRIDYRTCKTIEEAKMKPWIKQWHEGGINHREANGMIACHSLTKSVIWTMEINTIDELLKFIEQHGEVVIGEYYVSYIEHPGIIRIEIYDGYRE